MIRPLLTFTNMTSRKKKTISYSNFATAEAIANTLSPTITTVLKWICNGCNFTTTLPRVHLIILRDIINRQMHAFCNSIFVTGGDGR